MKIGFVGLGKLGLPSALSMETKGHQIVGYDISPKVREIVENKKIPYREIGTQELLEKSNIKLVTLEDIVEFSDLIFVAVQTPHNKKFEGITKIPNERVDFDYTFLKDATKNLAAEIEKQGKDKVVIIISTVLPGTIEREIKPLLNNYVKLCYNPFFIAMGTTMNDFLHPEFILFGVDNEEAASKAEAFYKTITSAPFYKTKVKNAELIKVAYNTYIGMKIAFANTLMEICHKTDTDVDAVTDALNLATNRLVSGKYFSGGMGDGGGCHPRDNIALSWLSRKLDLSYDWFENVMEARERQTEWLADMMEEYSLPKVILGIAYKPETDLVVGSPALLLKNILIERGHKVTIYDPHVNLSLSDEIKSIISKPCVFLIGTKHSDFIKFDFPKGSIVIDPWRYIPPKKDVKIIRIGDSSSN